MTTGMKIWRKILGLIFDKPLANQENKRLQQSYSSPIVRIHLRDSFRYYEKGRWTTVSGELMAIRDPQRIIYRRCPMKWSDTGESLTEAEREKVFQAVGEHLDKSKVRWEFSDATAPNWK